MDWNSLIKGLRAGTGFLTTIPVNVEDGDYDQFTGQIYTFIIIGIGIGVLMGIAGQIFQTFTPASLAPVLTIAFIYALTGINHLDGLSDMGDGIIATGTTDKKVSVMKDVHAGAGGILFISMDLLFLYSVISVFVGIGFSLLFALIVAEICAKTAMTTVATLGKSIHPGMGAVVIAGAKKDHYVKGLALAVAICCVTMGIAGFYYYLPWLASPGGIFYVAGRMATMAALGLLAITSAVAVAFGILIVADRNFGGVNGDVIGASNEIARIAALALMGILLWMHF